MNLRRIQFFLFTALMLASTSACAGDMGGGAGFQRDFDLKSCTMKTTGKAPYFIMEPGYQIVIESDDTKVQITVLDQTKTVDGIETRVIEEREWVDGELYEVALNYFAMCEQTKDVFYFGEGVDYYEKGKIVKHEGAWLAGENGNTAGMIMSGAPKVGMKYYQEIAEDVAMDRGEIISVSETCKTPAGTFSNCLKIKEGTALNPLETEYKYYAPNIGMIQDEDLKLVKHGMVK